MNQKQAKKLRRVARLEMNALGQAPERDLVISATVHRATGKRTGGRMLINEPLSVRAMERALKKAYMAAR